MTIQEGRFYKTRSGKTAEILRIYTTEQSRSKYLIHGVLWNEIAQDWLGERWTIEGHYAIGMSNEFDLVEDITNKEIFLYNYPVEWDGASIMRMKPEDKEKIEVIENEIAQKLTGKSAMVYARVVELN